MQPTTSYRLNPDRRYDSVGFGPGDIDAVAKSITPYEGKSQGRGITICAGGLVYFTNAWLLARMLRRLGCSLPIQFWYYGAQEMDERMIKLVVPYGVECVDAQRVARRHGVRLSQGWPMKPFSILYSPFEEVLALDADNLPIRNPEYLFAQKGYTDTGAIFWPDVGNTAPNQLIWKVMGVPYRAEPEFESGQILINKNLAWESLKLTMWMNEHGRAEFFYRLLWGDKDTFRMAWHKFGFPFAMTPVPLQMLSSEGGPCCAGVMCQHDLDGERIFQHRNLLKWQLFGTNLRVPGYFFEGDCREYLSELRALWNGRIGESPKPIPPIQKLADELVHGRWVLEVRKKGEDDLLVLPSPNVDISNTQDISDSQESPQATENLVGLSEPPEAVPSTSAIVEAAASTDGSQTSALTPWPKTRQRPARSIVFEAGGHCGISSTADVTFWDVISEKGIEYLRLSGRDGVGAVTAKLRRQADGSWYTRRTMGKDRRSMELRRIEEVFPSVTDGVPVRPRNSKSKRNLHVYNSGFGIGDHIVSVYACAAAASSGYAVTFHTHHAEWLRRVQHPGLTISAAPPENFEKSVDLNSDPYSQVQFGRTRAAWYAQYIESGLTPRRPDFVDRQVHVSRLDFERYVVLAPLAAWKWREWPATHWVRLVHLLSEEGLEVVAVGAEKDAARFEWLLGRTTALWALGHAPDWLADAILGSQCVIGNDSGICHFGGLLDVPTVSIHSHLPAEFLYWPANVTSVTPTSSCVFCRYDKERGFHHTCTDGCSALGTVTPEHVVARVLTLTKSDLRETFTASGTNGFSQRGPAAATVTTL